MTSRPRVTRSDRFILLGPDPMAPGGWKNPIPARQEDWDANQRMRGTIRNNYATGFDQANDLQVSLGGDFFPRWNADAEHLGKDRLGLSTEHGAALLAHLSPSNEAELNRIQGYQMVHLLDSPAGGTFIHHINQAAIHSGIAASLTSKARARSTPIKDSLRMLEQAEIHSALAAKHRLLSGIKGTPLNGQGSRILNSAVQSLFTDDPLSTLGALKIRDFGDSIAGVSGAGIPMDTHYFDLGLGRTDIPYDLDRKMGEKGRYRGMQLLAEEAYRGLRPGVPIHHFMAGGWYHQQHRKIENNPAAAKSRKASISRISGILSDSRFAPFLPQSYGMDAPIDTYGRYILPR